MFGDAGYLNPLPQLVGHLEVRVSFHAYPALSIYLGHTGARPPLFVGLFMTYCQVPTRSLALDTTS